MRGYSHRMAFKTIRAHWADQRHLGRPIYAVAPPVNGPTVAEVIANGRLPRLRGLQAFRFAGAIRTLAQLLRRALHFVLDVTSTLGKTLLAQT
jgi:hypothetical protein